jgi:hypothetical protein
VIIDITKGKNQFVFVIIFVQDKFQVISKAFHKKNTSITIKILQINPDIKAQSVFTQIVFIFISFGQKSLLAIFL